MPRQDHRFWRGIFAPREGDMSQRSEMTKLLKAAQKQGCTVTRTKGSHWKVVTPSGAVIFTAFSPGSRTAIRDYRQRLRRAGVNI
jgi:predicted RNA binding protein YcfA (HicA-like mRNA interferase family)